MSHKLIGAAAVILDSEGRVLLVKHSYGKNNWDLPGGKAEKDESAQETAKREVLEETGLEVTVGQLTGIYYDPGYDMHHFVFLSNNDHNQQPQPSSPEILECRYCSIDDLPKPISDFTYKRIQEALDKDRQHLFHVIGPRQWIE
ncbi:NUDIX domain-containing protein [Paenibacillus sp. sptzw28]|uniref:NUDIX hydrolase n=1 Tax=Paenibacillus sp. sptzw28 TaxID=715179 RepID=UPI001C6E0432|nr:NUDIX domain-containing protein [Paenibacillus sp. sptzw28]QYR22443.1 NUDIX domain-containing protein [Paenibacillus sp. sptzw28]